MPPTSLNRVADYLCKVASRHLAETMSDRELLERFVIHKEEAAFAAVVARHGPMVRAVCLRLLKQDADADDAFQATFLILLRKASAIAKRESLASWLHGVAHRVASRARKLIAREKQIEASDEAQASTDDSQNIQVRELQQWLDRAVQALPERYRACFILCCMEGRSYAHAARVLGCAEGTVSSRVVRARERLRSSFDRSGLGASAGLLALDMSRITLPLPAGVFETVLQFMRDGGIVNTLATSKAALLAKGVLDSMFIAKAKLVSALAIVVLASAGVTTNAYFESRVSGTSQAEMSADHKTIRSEDLVNIPARQEGVIQFLGIAIKPGEKVDEPRLFTVEVKGEPFKHRRLRVGDIVEKGEVIGSVDDALARAEVKIQLAKKKSAEAEQRSSEKTKDEASQRWQTAKKLYEKNAKSISLEDVRGAELTYQRYFFEVESKKESVEIAKVELEKANAVLEENQIRSGVRGIVRRVHKHPGEAVRKLETVVTLEMLPGDD